MAPLIRSVGGLSKCFNQGLWMSNLIVDAIGSSINRRGVAWEFPHHVTVSSSVSERFLYGFPYRFQRAWTVQWSMKHPLDVMWVGAWNSQKPLDSYLHTETPWHSYRPTETPRLLPVHWDHLILLTIRLTPNETPTRHLHTETLCDSYLHNGTPWYSYLHTETPWILLTHWDGKILLPAHWDPCRDPQKHTGTL